ncbi:type IX secretion system protein PorQ [Palleniella muris]|uniref:Type IX secretion system protein PorQ n=1 Tax=Palleniella muris TaxID=3038145 RepID=A0AC61QPP3_9BACT|nr:type IX secretion system protein PorQ [Palleniella muris]TGX81835.1 type IX secretion system protein PorQ [Palleniella muris]
MKRTLSTCLFLILTANLWSQDESRTEYNFLRLPVSAHAAALGGDNITIPDDDLMMMFQNPSLIIGATPKTVGLQYMNYMSGCHNASAAFNMVFKEKWNVGIGVQYMGYGSMQHRDEYNNDLGTFSATDIALSGVLGYELMENLAGGIAAKMVYGNISSYTSLAVAVDLGLNYYLPDVEWSFSLVVKNLGGQIKAYDNNYEKMPLDIQLGVSKQLGTSPLRLSATLVDLNHLNYKIINHLSIGAEALLSEQFYVAGGYSFRRADEMKTIDSEGNSSAHSAGLSIGAGINLERFRLNLSYAKYHVSSSSIIANIAFIL